MEAAMARKPNRKEREEQELEEGLEESFPASDPPAVTQPDHREPRRKER
jgi:hypothetical protein